jgi:hypothetical protein
VYTTLQVYFENKSLKGDFIPMKGNNWIPMEFL